MGKLRLDLTLSSARRYMSALRVTKKAMPTETKEKELRNIGIIAHIDAGKTTTTERMLFNSGATRCIGDVDDGDTVTDYLDQVCNGMRKKCVARGVSSRIQPSDTPFAERERGITITSAGVNFKWRNAFVNLIDTPGHVDFTVEVERVLRALDSTVTVLDASAGVEAQTLTVWEQANRYSLPSCVLLNKMDKEKANVSDSVKSIQEKLSVVPIVTQYPVGVGKQFCGVIDLVSLKKKLWKEDSSRNLTVMTETQIDDWRKNAKLYDEALRWRESMLHDLSDVDDEIATKIIQSSRLNDISTSDVQAAMRRATLSRKAVCVYLGSSLRNVGVQPLLDAVVDLLPNPDESLPDFVEHFRGKLCAVAFKVVYDSLLGYLTFLRVFSGMLKPGQRLLVTRTGQHEKTLRLYRAFGEQLQEVDSVSAGNIAVVTGLKEASTGDLLCSSLPDGVDTEALLLTCGTNFPEPVFFSSIEAGSAVQQQALDKALERVCREDPSISVKLDEDTGQTVLGGMGELHLDITMDRLKRDFGVDAYMGPLQVAYKETIAQSVTDALTFSRVIDDRKHLCVLKITAFSADDQNLNGKRFKFVNPRRTGENEHNLASIKPYQWKAIENGVKGALRAGPFMSFPVIGVGFYLEWFEVGPGTSHIMITAAAATLVQQILKQSGTVVMEPIMDLEIIVDGDYLSPILADLSTRRGVLSNIGSRQDLKVVKAAVPLAELVGYSTAFRKLCSGLGTFSMQIGQYAALDPKLQDDLAQKMFGFRPR
ncbi:unnamed protein product [Notodromas monacha]|uniref:Tr-type G domain-containing protein n=1 Tax=Notodromas monacha TaxID=399045 RepID=A0A7R9GF49_9CRUS|nr:unnamed protein product [Notodromas monacha]CAG0920427.1 unnamed protein product [Notodromas monacha]